MEPPAFHRYNVAGAVAWVPPLTLAGFFFGELPWVQQNFGLIYLALVVVTAIPLLWGIGKLTMEQMQGRRRKKKGPANG